MPVFWVLVFEVTSAGPAIAQTVELNAAIQGMAEIVSTSASCDAEAQAMQCMVTDLAAGESVLLEANVEADAIGDIFVTASVQFEEDNNSNNDTIATAYSVAEQYLVNAAPQTGTYKRDSVIGDVNGDGFNDVVFVNGQDQNDTVFVNTGSGQLTLLAELPDDLDGDEDLDLVVANCADHPNQIYFNDGQGMFSLQAELGDSDSRDVAVADFNGDDLPDIVFANANGTNNLYQNNGDGSFSLADSFDEGHSLAVEQADLNQDGLPDLVVVNADSDNAIYMNAAATGDHTYSYDSVSTWFVSPILLESNNANDVAVLDVNSDGFLDLLFANGMSIHSQSAAANTLYLNQNDDFELSDEIGAVATQSLVVADIDQDGFSDVIFVNQRSGHQFYFGDGNGLTLSPLAVFGSQLRNLSVADLNNDGEMDLVLADNSSEEQTILLQDNGGFVAPSADMVVSLDASTLVTALDETVTFSLTVTHPGTPFSAQDASVMIMLDGNLTVVEGLSQCDAQSGTYTCALGDLSSNAELSFDVQVDAASGELEVSASVISTTQDPVAENNTAMISVRANQAPQTGADSASTEKNTAVTISVLSNDQDDVQLDTSSVEIVSQPANGSVSVSASGVITYTPTTDFTGTDSFTYAVSDSDGAQSSATSVTVSVQEPSGGGGGAINIYLLLGLITLAGIRRFRLANSGV